MKAKRLAVYAIALLMTMALTFAPTVKTNAQIVEIIKAAITAAIKAIDVKIQQLQNKTIVLQNAQKVVENTMSKLKLNEITDFAQKERDLFSNYYQELQQVKSVIAGYKQVQDIIKMQTQMVSDYKAAYNLFKNDSHFKPEEINYMYAVYSGIMDKSVKELSALTTVISSFSTQMSDGKRLDMIEKLATDMTNNRMDLLQFNRRNMQVSLNRSASVSEVAAVKTYYGLQ
jgi:hypothetical protein